MPHDADLIRVKDRAAWRRWLSRNHERGAGVWLAVHKKDSRSGSLSYEDAVLEALCFGWIDSTAKSIDEDTYGLWLAPRKPKSIWSALNKARVEVLVTEGAMEPPGAAAIETAKANGAWSALDASDALIVPDDLDSAFAAQPAVARQNWDGFPPGVRKQILGWINA
ncbi:MAG TPA: YdeI/OmpD-associated family protein, partial [Actinomycetota bacterium]